MNGLTVELTAVNRAPMVKVDVGSTVKRIAPIGRHTQAAKQVTNVPIVVPIKHIVRHIVVVEEVAVDRS